MTPPGLNPTEETISTPDGASGRPAGSTTIASQAEVTSGAADVSPKQESACTTAPADVMSLDCGDELLEDEDRELCEIDSMATCADEYMYMTTITHAGKIQHVGMDGSVALQAGYDASDNRYAADLPAAGSPDSTTTAADAEHDSQVGADGSMDDEYFYDDGEDDIDSDDEDGWDETGDALEVGETDPRDFSQIASASSLVGEWYYYNTITHQVSA